MNGPIWWLNATAYGHADFLVNYYIADNSSALLHIHSMKLINNLHFFRILSTKTLSR